MFHENGHPNTFGSEVTTHAQFAPDGNFSMPFLAFQVHGLYDE